MDDRRRSFLRTTTALMLAAQLANVAPVLAAVAPAKPAATAARPGGAVARAQAYYQDARYDEAVGLLSGPVLRKELTGDELREARIVLARCYVKKGIKTRAREYFGAVIAADPAFVLDSSRGDAEEIAMFNEVKGVPAAAPAPAAAKPAAGESKPPATTPPAPAQPQLHKPEAEPTTSARAGWLSRNKYLTIAIVAGGGVAAGLALSGGGGGGSSTPPGPANLPGFPSPPGGH